MVARAEQLARAAVGRGRGRGGGRGAARRDGWCPDGSGWSRSWRWRWRRVFAGYVVSGPELELLRPRHWDELFAGLGRRLPGARHRPAALCQRRSVAADRARAARHRVADPRRAAHVLAALGGRAGPAGAARGARSRLSVRRPGRADHRRGVARGIARRAGVAAAGAGARGAVGLLPVAGAAAAAAGAGGRGAAGDRAGRRAAAGGDGRPWRAVVRLPLVRRESRARRPRAVLVDAELRADRLAAQRQRGDAGHVERAVVLEGAQPRRL